jgi:carbamoyl-phosphate synthase large subunit
MRRKLQAGTTVAAELGEFPEISDGAGEIARALRPFGPCNIQLRLRNGRPVAFDINPRFSGTTAVRARMGFNEVEAALRHFVCEQPVPPLMGAQGGVALRYWNELYVTAETLRALTADGRLERWPVPTVEDWGRDS